ncbi:20251_t:CDS:1, partial [Gigaspora margarita]
MVNKKITIRLPSDLEKKLKYVETISGKSKEFIFQEALLKFFEGLENTPKVPELRKKKQE